MAVRWFSVPARSPNLLYVTLIRLGQCVVYDTADVRLIYPHTKCHSRHDNPQSASHEGVLYPASLGRGHTSVVTLSTPGTSGGRLLLRLTTYKTQTMDQCG